MCDGFPQPCEHFLGISHVVYCALTIEAQIRLYILMSRFASIALRSLLVSLMMCMQMVLFAIW
jgi:hypothetical protein